jgi:hypothetical protein
MMMFNATNEIHLIALWAHKYLELLMTNVVLKNPIVGQVAKPPRNLVLLVMAMFPNSN